MIDASIVWSLIHSKMKVKKGYSVEVIQDSPHYFVCDIQISNSETLKSIQVVLHSEKNPKKLTIEFTGSSPIVVRPNIVDVHKNCSHCAGLLDRFIVEAENNIPSHSIGRRASQENLTRDVINKINESLLEVSYIGYPNVESLLSAIYKVIRDFKLDFEDAISAHWLKQKSGVFSSDILDFKNNKLAVSFYLNEEIGFVADCYVV